MIFVLKNFCQQSHFNKLCLILLGLLENVGELLDLLSGGQKKVEYGKILGGFESLTMLYLTAFASFIHSVKVALHSAQKV